MPRLTLDQILSLDEHEGLLDVKAPLREPSREHARLFHDFEEICRFVEASGAEPRLSMEGAKLSARERMLAMRLRTYRTDPDVIEILRESDTLGLLHTDGGDHIGAESLDEILNSDSDLLSGRSDAIFEKRFARGRSAKPDKVSERRPARDFDSFRPLFDKCLADLVSGRRKSIRFANEQEINAGDFFILNGVMVFVAEVNDPHVRNGKKNARLRLIFENGTEGENLLRSLATELYKDPSGRRISDPNAGPLFAKAEEDIAAKACIYVVQSLSTQPEIAAMLGGLYKIGFTTGSFEQRIRNAKDDPTFLFAAVNPVRTYEVSDVNLRRLEHLIHYFFGARRLDIELADRFGRPYRPKEWFAVPLRVIEQAVPMMLDGSILGYHYDAETESIVRN